VIKTVDLVKFAARHACVYILMRNFARWHHNYVNLVYFVGKKLVIITSTFVNILYQLCLWQL